jgi:hypothetical protein
MRSILREARSGGGRAGGASSARWHRRAALAALVCAAGCACALVPAGARAQQADAASAASPGPSMSARADADRADSPAPAPSAASTSGSSSGRTSAAQVEEAVRALRADPLLSGSHKVRRLRFKDEAPEHPAQKPRQQQADKSGWLDGLLAFARFLDDTSRLLVYGLGVVLVALLAVNLRRFLRLREARRRPAGAGPVSHVRDLDVRPGSLPDDVGAAARALWRSGDIAAALSLLYRGALSRLIHRHGVAIAASTTEGECVELARGRLEPGAQRYLTQLVLARQAATYGQRTLSMAMGEALCEGFAARLDGAVVPPGPALARQEAAS